MKISREKLALAKARACMSSNEIIEAGIPKGTLANICRTEISPKTAGILAKILKVEENAGMSPEELIMLVEEVQQEGTLDDDDSELIRNAIEFADLSAEDILTHRVDLEAVSIEDDKVDIARKFKETQFSRLLVYNENIDDIVGIIHLKDFYSEKGITDKDV